MISPRVLAGLVADVCVLVHRFMFAYLCVLVRTLPVYGTYVYMRVCVRLGSISLTTKMSWPWITTKVLLRSVFNAVVIK